MSTNPSQLTTLWSASIAAKVFNTPVLFKRLLHQLTQELHKLMPLNDLHQRTKGFSKFQDYQLNYSTVMAKKVTAAQAPKARELPGLTKSQEKLKETVLKDINHLVNDCGQSLAFIQCGINNANNKVGLCQEYTALAFAYLVKFNAFHKKRLEIVILESKINPMENHGLVLINRADNSQLIDVDSWGKDCLIYDPLWKIDYTIESIPEGFSLETIQKFKEQALCTLKEQADNDLGSTLCSKYKNTVFSDILKTTKEACDRTFSQSIQNMGGLNLDTRLITNAFVEGTKDKLAALSALSLQQIQSYQQGQVYLLKCDNSQQAKDIATSLNSSQSVKAQASQVKKTGQDVVMVKDIDVIKFFALEVTAKTAQSLEQTPPVFSL